MLRADWQSNMSLSAHTQTQGYFPTPTQPVYPFTECFMCENVLAFLGQTLAIGLHVKGTVHPRMKVLS